MARVEPQKRPQEEAIDALIQSAARCLIEEQEPEGYWADCFDTGVMPDAQTAISLFLLDVIDPDWSDPLLRRIFHHQRMDGSWGVYPEDDGDLSTTVECYYALQLYGKWDDHPIAKDRAEAFIRQHGGLRKCRNLTKVFLALGGEIPWSWLPSARLYSLLFQRGFPVRHTLGLFV